jgi:hypothetical protein
MITKFDILERNSGRLDVPEVVIKSSDANEIYSFLQQSYDKDINNDFNEEYDNHLNMSGYVDNLEKVVEMKKIHYKSGSEINDPVELNILAEQSLLEYDNKFGDINALKQFYNVDNVKELLDRLDVENAGLLRHYVELLKLGHVTEYNNSITSSSSFSNGNALLDDLTATMLTLAVEKRVQLPAAEEAVDAQSRLAWFTECLHRVAGSKPIGAVSSDDTSSTGDALRDLQFAHSYLTKKYHEEMATHGQYVQNMTARCGRAELLLRETTAELQATANRLMQSELQLAEASRHLETRTRETHELIMQNALLRVDVLGSPASPAGSLSGLMGIERPLSPPMSPATPGTPKSSSSVSNGDPPSVRILRMEFKKLVEQLNARFAREIEAVKRDTQLQSISQ